MRRISEAGKKRKEQKKIDLERLHQWLFELFDKRKDQDGYVYCYESGVRMHESKYKYNLLIYSHCYPKASYPQYAMEEWNVLIVMPEKHNQWGDDRSKTPRMKEYFDNLVNNL